LEHRRHLPSPSPGREREESSHRLTSLPLTCPHRHSRWPTAAPESYKGERDKGERGRKKGMREDDMWVPQYFIM
jgi:hypothetical protein